MGEVIDFPKNRSVIDTPPDNLENDPYFRFIRNVLHTADSYGFELPFTIESAAEHVYHKTRHKSQLARMLAETEATD
jgi:hypothetical protein